METAKLHPGQFPVGSAISRAAARARRSSIPAGMTFEEAEAAAGLPPTRMDGDYLRVILDDRIRTQPSQKHLKPEWKD